MHSSRGPPWRLAGPLVVLLVLALSLGAVAMKPSQRSARKHIVLHEDPQHNPEMPAFAELFSSTRASNNALGLSAADAIKFYYTLDTDKKGLDFAEFKAFFGEKAGMAADKLLAFWKKLDFNGSGVVSAAEWLQFFFPDGDASIDTTGEAFEALTLQDAEIIFNASGNAIEHHTIGYLPFQITKDNKLVVRRGQPFYIRVVLPIHTANNASNVNGITFTIGKHTVTNVGSNELSLNLWNAKPVRTDIYRKDSSRTVVTFAITSPYDAPIGKYPISILGPAIRSRLIGQMMLLFNPWVKPDATYYADTEMLKEYLLSPDGALFFGDVLDAGLQGVSQMAWGYHQYEVVESVLNLLSDLTEEDLKDPITVSRSLTWMLNSAGNPSGVLMGRWDGQYGDDMKPTDWTGSRAIFDKWDATKTTVKYGQCWVFAGLLVSSLRAIGIPARPVTTFRSAHDTPPYDLVIDRSIGESVWNFHVWVDAWMKRPDVTATLSALGVGLADGTWNAVDATPQEKSSGKYQMGPASVPLVQNNKNKEKYDTMFVIGETNANVWLGQGTYDPTKNYSASDLDVQDVGQFISTSRPGCSQLDAPSDCRQDITNTYKVASKTPQWRFSSKNHAFKVDITPVRPKMGDTVKLLVSRSALQLSEPIWVNISIAADLITYTGRFIRNLRTMAGYCRLTPSPGDPKDTCKDTTGGWYLNLDPSFYVNYLTVSNNIRLTVSIKEYYNNSLIPIAGETALKREFLWEKQFTLLPPQVTIQTNPTYIETGAPYTVVVTFKNPLPITLTNITLFLDTPDFDRVSRFAAGTILANGNAQLVTSAMSSSMVGNFALNVAISANEVVGLRGTKRLDIRAASLEAKEERLSADKTIANAISNAFPSSAPAASASTSSSM